MTSPKTAVVTGASSGIGAATARQLAAAGYHVFCAARRRDRIEALAAEIGGTAVECDVTSVESVAGLAAAVGERLDVLVNNAGGAFGASPVSAADGDEWRQMYEVNVIGLMQVTRALLPALVASGAGAIVNVGSTAARRGVNGGSAYCSSKFALSGLTECWRAELRKSNVRVMQVDPSEVQNDFGVNAGRAARKASNPSKLVSEDIARAIVALLELDDRSFVPDLEVWATNPTS